MALRTPLSVTPHLYMGDSTGRPLDKGVVYFGEQDKDPEFYPINLFSDDALTKPLMQPVNTKGGYLYDKGDMVEPHAKEFIYSVKVLDSYGRKVFYKGAMMRNSWNDDVINQINTAILETQEATAAIAGQVAADAVGAAITDIATAGASQNGWTDLLIATESGGNQREVNKKTVFEYDTVAAMLADTKIVAGKVVSTNGYHAKQDGGGAKYTISLTPTDYSIPLSNGLHAVFSDTFDIRKFGIRDSKTLNQETELLRMRNYADTREYIIDFHNFNIMRPNLNSGITSGYPHSLVNGLWFNKPHHYKNLTMHYDSSRRLETGDSMLIFAPDTNPDVETFTIFENITLDPWNPNFQPFSENYSGHYDGYRHGILIHPKGSWNALFDPAQKDAATNHSFSFVNVNFLSSAYSYNITTAGLRARTIEVDGLRGDCIVGLNTDCRYFYSNNVNMRVRFDLIETGRLMVSDVIHFEPEHGGSNKVGITFEYDIYVKNSNATRKNEDGSAEDSGQLFWFTPIGTSVINVLDIDNCSGNVEIHRAELHTKLVNIHGCKKLIWFTCAMTTVDSIKISDSVVGRLVGNNSGYFPAVYDSKVQLFEVQNCQFRQFLFFGAVTTSPQVVRLVLDNITIKNELGGNPRPFIGGVNITEVALKNSNLKDLTSAFMHFTYDVESVSIDNVILDNIGIQSLISLKYTSVSKSTKATLRNVSIIGAQSYEKINMAGTLDIIGLDTASLPDISTPITTGDGTIGTGVLAINMDRVTAPATLNKTYTLTDTVDANNVVKKTYPVNKDCKYAALSLSLPTDLVVSQYRQGDNIVITLANNTSSPISLASNILTVKQII